MRFASTAGEGVGSFWSEDIKLAVQSADDDLTVVAYAARTGQQGKGRVDQFVQVDRDTTEVEVGATDACGGGFGADDLCAVVDTATGEGQLEEGVVPEQIA